MGGRSGGGVGPREARPAPHRSVLTDTHPSVQAEGSMTPGMVNTKLCVGGSRAIPEGSPLFSCIPVLPR